MKMVIAALLVLGGTLFANDYNKGVDAYKNGDYKSALELWRPYAVDGNVRAQYYIANIYHEGKGGVEQNYKKALYWYHAAAAQDHPKSLLLIGLMHCKGEGVLKSYKEAVPFIRSAYKNGCRQAPKAWAKYELWKYE